MDSSNQPSSARSSNLRLLLIGALTIAIAVGGFLYWKRAPSDKGESPPPSGGPVAPVDAASGPIVFLDVTHDSGVQFGYRNGEEANHFSILESLGGGAALFDFDGDGLLDLFVTGGGYFGGADGKEIKGYPCRIYRNLGGCKFQDVTREAGLEREWWYTHGVAVADFDCDGWPDLLVTGYGRLALFHNESTANGRRFVDVTDKVGLNDSAWSTSAGWADLDGDGYPDLYVCHYVDWSFANHPVCRGNARNIERDICNPERFQPLVHALFHNEKGKSFRDVSAKYGFKPTGCGLGVVLADINGDGLPDIYVGNDTNNNFLYYNRRGSLEERGALSGAAADETGRADGSMGVDVGDYDGSGRASIFVTNFQNEVHALYANLGGERFHHASRASGIAGLSRQLVGFGTAFVDFDNDGWEDLVFVNGHVWRYPVAGTPKQKPVLLQNVDQDGRRFFRDASARGGPFFQTPALGRGLAVGDIDNDGWPDLVVSNTNGTISILCNQPAATNANRWLGIKLVGRNNRDIVGSTVTIEGNTRNWTRFVKGGGSYLSSGDRRLLFGLGPSEQIKRVIVKWSWGETEIWDKLEANAYWELREGDRVAKRIPARPH